MKSNRLFDRKNSTQHYVKKTTCQSWCVTFLLLLVLFICALSTFIENILFVYLLWCFMSFVESHVSWFTVLICMYLYVCVRFSQMCANFQQRHVSLHGEYVFFSSLYIRASYLCLFHLILLHCWCWCCCFCRIFVVCVFPTLNNYSKSRNLNMLPADVYM